ncbi:HAD-IA family hydrolase [Pararhizobium mangrovi]|uniref:HAD-IA family hydrolase n=1 Tax=Pararhizobium mangrovi TaxID=2590452 RepID=A0A506U504_9HYPH|nr:HAD-IA family hydrolase [Pararhizobium mangrovi]TPW28154.1 HAD-IA family hydrolase [Pararhizobium mangrovi]
MTPFDLVIFDCDGVLVDSEPISIAVLVETIEKAGGRINEADAHRRFLGKSLKTIRDLLEREDGLVIDEAELAAMRTRLHARFERELKPVPGVEAALARLDCRRCVASSSQPERIRLTLAITGLDVFFGDAIFSATMVAEGKPAPDLFLYAAASMNAAPAQCLVIEDSVAGIAAAKAAGMRVFAFTGGAHASGEDYRKSLAALDPDAIFDDMQTLPELIAAQGMV